MLCLSDRLLQSEFLKRSSAQIRERICILQYKDSLPNSHQSTISQSRVKYLPGFEGPLPFELETGYVGVDESEVELFYYFVKSEKNPDYDPIILWLAGGPGCSSFNAFIFAFGPLYFRPVKYNGRLPTLVLNPNSWTKTASIIFLDVPFGTGFSYATTPRASHSDQFQSCHQVYQFLQNWLIGHSEFISNPIYIAGDSYSGLTVPIITHIISDGNEGYLLGNPTTNYPEEENYRIPFAHGMGLISDEFYESLVKNCGGEYQNRNSNNVECLKNMEAYGKCVSHINDYNILEPYESSHKSVRRERVLSEKLINLHDDVFHPSSSFSRDDRYELSNKWMNDKSVRNALHIRNITAKEWVRCNTSLPYRTPVRDTRPYHLCLSKKGYRSLIYSGDHDMAVPSISTQAWIRNLNYSIVDDWRSWFTDDEQVAGYTRTSLIR